MYDVYGGTGFIGGCYCALYPNIYIVPREETKPNNKDIIYFISTVDNYNIFSDPFIDINTNLIHLMKVLLECKAKQITFNFISSWFVYGDSDEELFEHSTCNPKGFYSITKRTAELLLIEFCETFCIKYRIIRLPNVIGLTDNKVSDKKNALQNLIYKLKCNEDVTLFDGGEFTRDYMFVSDVCAAINLIVETGELDSIYNVGSGIPTKFIDIVKSCHALIGSSSNILFEDTPKKYLRYKINNCHLNVDKLNNLGFCSSGNFNEGLVLLCQ